MTLSTILLAGLLLWLLGQATLRTHTIRLNLLSVPIQLANDGFSSVVVTNLVLDAVTSVEAAAGTMMRTTAFDIPTSLPTITVEKSGVSIENLAASIRSVLPDGWQHEISGEFTFTDSRLSLRMRLNGQIIFSDSEAGLGGADALIQRSARGIWEKIQPYVVASYLYNTDKSAANDFATLIIETLPPSDENVAYAYNLKGADISRSRQN